MGKFYVRGRGDAPEYIGIDLTDMTTGVGLFIGTHGTYASARLTPDEAERLAAELVRVAAVVREDNR